MADSATGVERSFDPAAYSPVLTGNPSRQGQQPVDEGQPELASLIRLGTAKQEAGEFSEAADYFRRALEVGDRTFGSENPDLIILLNDLTRLYLRQSAYASAEPLLLRLLELKRSKGEDHPEVATVLASLAAVRRALGMHESAEQLWRRVLDIRERTLAPNHFATASALEHLGDACAARGKIREALSAFQRALNIRETTLGAEHPSLRVARERIADLELQASEDMLYPSAVIDTPVAPERYRLLSGIEPAGRSATPVPELPTPQIRLAPQPAPKATPAAEPRPREKKNSLAIPRTYTPPALPADEAPQEPNRRETVVMPIPVVEPRARDDDETPALATATVAYRDALESVREELEADSDTNTIGEHARNWLPLAAAFLGRREVVAGITLTAIVMLGVAVATDRHAFGETGPAVSEQSAIVPQKPNVASAAPLTTREQTSTPAIASADAIPSKAVKPRPAEDRSSAKKVADKKSDPPARVALPSLSTSVLSRLDSVASKAATVGSNAPDQFTLATAPTAVSQRRSTFDATDGNGPQRARLIGELPTPKVPNQVTDVEGEVRVRFNVDTLGRPILETFSVVSSPNPLLTAAVRKVIPGMRFEPARTAGPESKPIGDVVQIGFQFARTR